MRDKRQEAGRAPSWGDPTVYPRPKGKQIPGCRKPACGPEDRRPTGWDRACEWVPPRPPAPSSHPGPAGEAVTRTCPQRQKTVEGGVQAGVAGGFTQEGGNHLISAPGGEWGPHWSAARWPSVGPSRTAATPVFLVVGTSHHTLPPELGAGAAGTGAQPSSRAETDTQIFLTATTQLGRVNLKLYPTARRWERFHQNPVLLAPRPEGLVGQESLLSPGQPRRVLSFLHRARVRTVGGRPCDEGDAHVPAQRAFPETSSVTPRMRPIRGLRSAISPPPGESAGPPVAAVPY